MRTVPKEEQARFFEEGYMILPNALSASELALLRDGCTAAIENQEARMRAAGKTEDGINLLGRRYFISGFREKHPALDQVIFGRLAEAACRATIGKTAYLHNEQFVVKLRDRESNFAWHQDSGYSVFRGGAAIHEPYLTCWLALDDMSVANGTIYVLPYSRAGTKYLLDHRWCEEANAMVGYSGDDPGDPVEVPAGSLVAFSSFLLHRSGPNTTDKPRRSYFIAYTPTLFTYQDVAKGVYSPCGEAFLKGGQRVKDYIPV